mgnify:CR=1 FL=1
MDEMPMMAVASEHAVVLARDHDHACACLAADIVDAVTNLVAHLGGKHIAVIGTVEGKPANRALFFVNYCFKEHFSKSPLEF